MSNAFIKLFVSAQAFRSRLDERGQGSLEYIAIVVGLIVLVYLGFQAAGGDIGDKAQCFVSKVTGEVCDTNNGN